MPIINPADISYTRDEIKDINEAVHELAFNNPVLNSIHRVETGIKAAKALVILGRFTGLAGKKQTACSPTPNANGIKGTDKTWTPKYIADRFVQCYADLLTEFYAWGLKEGINKPDLTGTDWDNFVQMRMKELIEETILRKVYFDDTALVAGTGNNLSAGDAAYFKDLDGFWKQAFAIVTADADRRYTIAKNAEATYEDQEFDDADTTAKTATKILQNITRKADSRLKGLSNDQKVILATQSIVDQYTLELESQGVDASFVKIESGHTAILYNGIAVVAFDLWDRVIRAYFDNGTKYILPHRAWYTTKKNLAIGTENEGILDEFNPFYDAVTKQYFIDFGFMLDAKVVEDNMNQLAY